MQGRFHAGTVLVASEHFEAVLQVAVAFEVFALQRFACLQAALQSLQRVGNRVEVVACPRHPFQKGAFAVGRRFLWERNDACVTRDCALARVRLQIAGEYAQQRRLSTAVDAHQGSLLARLQVERHVVQQLFAAVIEPDATQAQKRQRGSLRDDAVLARNTVRRGPAGGSTHFTSA